MYGNNDIFKRRGLKQRTDKKYVPRGPITTQGLGFKSNVPEYRSEYDEDTNEESKYEQLPELGCFKKSSSCVDNECNTYKGLRTREKERNENLKSMSYNAEADKRNKLFEKPVTDIPRSRTNTPQFHRPYTRSQISTRSSSIKFGDQVTDDVHNLINGIEREDKLTRRAREYRDEVTDSIAELTDSLDQFLEKTQQKRKQKSRK